MLIKLKIKREKAQECLSGWLALMIMKFKFKNRKKNKKHLTVVSEKRLMKFWIKTKGKGKKHHNDGSWKAWHTWLLVSTEKRKEQEHTMMVTQMNSLIKAFMDQRV